jgi:polyhydroxyalkanoic acid synthase PhaR subunit
MSDSSTNGTSVIDPFGFWKTVRDTQLESWSKLMIDFVNSEEYSRSTGLALEQFLETSQPFRNALERYMTQTLSLMNMPSKAEVISLAERLTNVEMRLDDLDAKLSDVHESLRDTVKETVGKAVADFPKPPTTKPLENRIEKLDARLGEIQTSVRDSVRESVKRVVADIPEPPSIKPLENGIEKLNARLDVLLERLNKAETPARAAAQPKPAPSKAEEPTSKPAPEKA